MSKDARTEAMSERSKRWESSSESDLTHQWSLVGRRDMDCIDVAVGWWAADADEARQLAAALLEAANWLEAASADLMPLGEQEAQARHAGFLAAIAETDQRIVDAVERDERIAGS